jgi:hypothetical protein
MFFEWEITLIQFNVLIVLDAVSEYARSVKNRSFTGM